MFKHRAEKAIFVAKSFVMAKKFTFSFEFDKTFSLVIQSIEHRLQELATTFKPFHFIRGTWREVSMKAEHTEAPFIVLFAPEGGSLVNKGDWMSDGVRLRLGFFDLVNREAWAEDNMAVQQAMRAAGEVFLRALNETGYFEPITTITYDFYNEMFSCVASGVVFTITLQGGPLCIPSVRVEQEEQNNGGANEGQEVTDVDSDQNG